jgi:hypothetical protein
MVPGVIADDHHPTLRIAAGLAEHQEELKESLRIESTRFPPEQELAVPQTHGAKVSDALARRRMKQDGVLDLGRYPHAAARSMLLEVDFVGGPQIDGGIQH